MKAHTRKPTLQERVQHLWIKYVADCVTIGPSSSQRNTLSIAVSLDETRLKCLMLDDPSCDLETAAIIRKMDFEDR